jgi:hypothetical protein
MYIATYANNAHVLLWLSASHRDDQQYKHTACDWKVIQQYKESD